MAVYSEGENREVLALAAVGGAMVVAAGAYRAMAYADQVG